MKRGLISMEAEEIKVFSRDEFGPERIFRVVEKETGKLRACLVIDNTVMGKPAVGGTFMLPNLNWQELYNLTAAKARRMTLKSALSHLRESVARPNDPIEWGGSKLGIVGPPEDGVQKYAIIRGAARALFEAQIIPQWHLFGLDVNINEKHSAMVVKELGSVRTVAGTLARYGSIPFDKLGITGFGAVEALEVMAEFAGVNLEKATAAIQGSGAVGRGVLRGLERKGVKILAISDKNERNQALYNPGGLEVKKLLRSLKKTGTVINYSGKAERIPLGEELWLAVDILVLAARESVIVSEDQAKRVKVKIVLEPANLAVSPAAQKLFLERGIVHLPDIAVNSGGVIAAFVDWKFMDILSLQEKIALAFREVAYSARTVARKLLEKSQKDGRMPLEIAMGIIRERISQKKRS